jgi:hypothetical protein
LGFRKLRVQEIGIQNIVFFMQMPSSSRNWHSFSHKCSDDGLSSYWKRKSYLIIIKKNNQLRVKNETNAIIDSIYGEHSFGCDLQNLTMFVLFQINYYNLKDYEIF